MHHRARGDGGRARELAGRGWTIHTLTNRRPPANARHVTSARLSCNPEHLATELRGADVFVNTYWIRRRSGDDDFCTAAYNNRILVDAAVRARVGRFCVACTEREHYLLQHTTLTLSRP